MVCRELEPRGEGVAHFLDPRLLRSAVAPGKRFISRDERGGARISELKSKIVAIIIVGRVSR